MLGRADDRRVFLFTSALPQEGKTFCSVNFAVSLAQQGLQTLLIDCDLRRPNVEMAMFGVRKSTIGVTDYLAGQRELMDHRPNRARVPVFPAEGKLNHQRQSAVSFPLSAQEEFVGAINMLVNRGADVNARDKQGHTPLKRAIDYQQQESAEVLRRVGAVE
jgi:cellulose biosynthesis protein BcsQ